MSKTKKVLSWLAAMMIFLTGMPMAALAEEAGAIAPEEEIGESAAQEIEYPEELVVGHTTVMKGDFFTEMFGNDTADIDVRALLHGYNLVNWDQNQGVYVFDPTIVTNVDVTEDEVGNRSYFLALADDLYYSDGTPITAWDYAFSMLLMMAPEIEQIGGKIYRPEHLLGYKGYITKEYDTLGGIMVYSDHQLVITLDHEFLPYFFETGLMLCEPYPIHVIAPGCKVYDDGYGCYIGNEDPALTEPLFTAELLERTILDPETGYNSHPSVVSGPYQMVSYDGVTAHFERNPYFKGAWINNTLVESDGENSEDPENPEVEGEQTAQRVAVPTIEKIAYTLEDNASIARDLRSGRIHLANKVTYGPTILECQGVQTGDEIAETDTEEEPETVSEIRMQNYPRIGLAFLTFTYDWPTVHDKEVRQAIAWCMDRDQLTQDYCQGFGVRVDGYYGIEQWEYLLVNHQMDYPVNFIDDDEHAEELKKLKNRYVTTEEEYEAAIAAWETLSLDNLTQYTVDTDKANALLNSAGWTLNREGDPYRPGTDDVRCKMVEGQLVALDLKMMYPEGNHIIDTLQENFIDHLNEAGIQLTLIPASMEELLQSYYRQTERTTDMIYLATNFHVVVDPSITYSTDDSAGHLMWNNTYSDDEDLYWRAVNMRKTDPGDTFDYVTKWISFQERYNEVLPTIPVYSNIYFDFYTPMLQNYYVTSHVTWSQAILEAYWGEDNIAEEEESEEVDDSDGEFFDD